MSDETTTDQVNPEQAAGAQANVTLEMPSAPVPEAPALTLDGAVGAAASPVQTKPEELVERARLTPAEQKQVDDFAQQIDIHDTAIIMQYGAGAQKKMSTFSENALTSVRSKDLGEVGDMLSSLVVELKSFDIKEEEQKGFLGFFKKTGNKITAMKARYATAESNVGQIVKTLEGHQVTLLKDIAMLDQMYGQNVVYFKELTMYILAGKKKLAEVEATELPALQQKAQESGLPEDAQAANDLANLCDRFSKKLHRTTSRSTSL